MDILLIISGILMFLLYCCFGFYVAKAFEDRWIVCSFHEGPIFSINLFFPIFVIGTKRHFFYFSNICSLTIRKYEK